MPWYFVLLEPIARLALKLGVGWLEQKFPGLAPLIEKIMEILKNSPAPVQDAQKLSMHLDSFVSVPSDIKKA